MAFTPGTKVAGDLIKSQEWNDVTTEITRLGNDKVNKAGDAMKGPLTIDGALGVGTTSPSVRVHVEGITDATAALAIRRSDKKKFVRLGVGDMGVGLDFDKTSFLSIQRNTSGVNGVFNGPELLRITSDGKVGLGTTDPKEILHVVGNLLGAAKDEAGNALRICCGKTPEGTTNWQVYSPNGIYVDVNTSSCGFQSVPAFITNIYGNTNHWSTAGATSIYNRSKDGFRVYIKWVDSAVLTPATANQNGWHIQWIAIGV